MRNRWVFNPIQRMRGEGLVGGDQAEQHVGGCEGIGGCRRGDVFSAINTTDMVSGS